MNISPIQFAQNSSVKKIYHNTHLHYLNNSAADTVSFSCKNHFLIKKTSACNSAQKLVHRIYGKDVDFIPNENGEFPRFTLAIKGNMKIGFGTVLYDENNKPQYLAVQEYKKDGYFEEEGQIKVYDFNGKLHKIMSETQTDSLLSYRGIMATGLNANLRYDHKIPVYEEHTKILDSLFENPLCYDVAQKDMVVYRGAKSNNYLEQCFAGKLTIGEAFLEKGFLSASTDKNIARKFGDFFFEIRIPKGTKYLDMTKLTSASKYFTPESEFLFPRNTRLFIENFDDSTNVFKMYLVNNAVEQN